jgi:hypothetical protein
MARASSCALLQHAPRVQGRGNELTGTHRDHGEQTGEQTHHCLLGTKHPCGFHRRIQSPPGSVLASDDALVAGVGLTILQAD